MTRYLGHSFITLGPSCFDVHGVKLQTGCEKISLLLIVSNDVILFSLSRKSFRARSIEYCACICKFKKCSYFGCPKTTPRLNMFLSKFCTHSTALTHCTPALKNFIVIVTSPV